MPYLLLTISALLWSGNFVLSRAMNATIPPAGFVFWRWLVAAIILTPIALPRLRREWPIVRANLQLICICGFFGVTLFNFLIYTAMHTTTAINAAITACKGAGGGTVYIPEGVYSISSPLLAGGGSPGALVIRGSGWNSQLKLCPIRRGPAAKLMRF